MYRTATIAAYDVMDEVFIAASVRLYDHCPEVPSEIELTCSAVVSGVGTGEGRVWLKDALVALIESL